MPPALGHYRLPCCSVSRSRSASWLVHVVADADTLTHFVGDTPTQKAPTFFAYKWYSREQERLADAAAGMAGYAEGGVQYWAKQLALKNSRRTTGSAAQIEQLTLWRSHPPMGTRYASLKSMAEIVRAQANPVAAAATPAATSPPVPPAGHT